MSRLFDNIFGHSNNINSILLSIKNNRLSPSLCFCGIDGIGKKLVAMATAQALVCENGSEACGQCPSCKRIENGQSESLLLIESENNIIKIEKSREIVRFLQLQNPAKSRIIIIDGANKLNPQAANALLKSLEEPPQNTYFFLICNSFNSLLQTIRSRSQFLSFKALTKNELKKIIPAPENLLKLANGSASQLHSLLSGDEQEAQKNTMQFLKSTYEDDFLNASKLIQDINKDKNSSFRFCTFLQHALRDLVVASDNSDKLLLIPQNSAILDKYKHLNQDQLEQVCKSSTQIEQDLNANLDRNLIIENLWVQLAKYCNNPKI